MPRKNNPQETIERIINASLKLFKEKGFDKTSMQDIVDASDMSKGAIFYHFKSKEEIFEATMDREYTHVKERFHAFVEKLEGDTAKEKMKKMITVTFADEEISTDSYDIFKAIINSPHLAMASMYKNTTEISPIVAGLIKEGIADGSIITNFPDELGEVFILLYNQWCNIYPFKCDLSTLRNRLKFLQHMMANLGCDIVTDEVIDFNMKLCEKYESVLKEVQND